jgi:hypothetical protein
MRADASVGDPLRPVDASGSLVVSQWAVTMLVRSAHPYHGLSQCLGELQ